MNQAAGRVLAIDLGDVRVGLAVSDALGITAQPVEGLRRAGPRKDFQRIREIVGRHDVRHVLVGNPLRLSGEVGTRARQARQFADRLREELDGLPVELWDERLTTVQAERALLAGNVRRRRRKEVIDSLAAVLILQNYLDAAASRDSDLA